MITETTALFATLLIMVAFSFYVQKFKFFKNVGPALTVIILGIILSNLHIVPSSHELYGIIGTYAIPVSISIMVLHVDLKKLMKLSKQPLVAMAVAVFSVSFMAILGGVLFGGKIEEGWKIAGMFVGTYTGGSPQLTAIGTGLNATSTTLAAANAADYVIGIPTLVLMFAAPGILKASKRFQKLWPYSLTEEELEGDGTHQELISSKEWSITEISILFAIGFTVTGIGMKVSTFFPSTISGAMRILAITTISLILAQTKPVQKLRGNLDLGLFMAMLFLCTIGISVVISEFFKSAIQITLLCAFIIIGSILMHLLITRLLKIKYQYVVLSITSAIADGTTAGLVAAGGGWKSLISVGILLGVIGGVVGNYVGFGVAFIIKALLGI